MTIEVLKSKINRVTVNNGERLETYVIEGVKNAGEITLNGPAARRVQKGDIVIIISYASMSVDKAKDFRPKLIFPDTATNSLV